MSNKTIRHMLWIIASIVVLTAIGIGVFLNRPIFGQLPEGDRLARIEKSPNYSDGKFRNRVPRAAIGENNSFFKVLRGLFFEKTVDRTPNVEIPSIRTNLKELPLDEDLMVWLGHSALYMHVDGKRFLVDPALTTASPVSFFNKPFKGSDRYQPDDIPAIDVLLITHDHWDHLDYYTITRVKERVSRFVCPLGVGAHLERWGIEPERITELDWEDTFQLDNTFAITALPARHFSGRGLTRDPSLWASYMLQSNFGNIFLSGDTGYDTHFQQIKERYGTIDLAVMENGQYNENWSDIHLMPGDLVTAIKELTPQRVMTVHHSKYALARHPWYEPLDNISQASYANHFPLVTPMIGEPVWLSDTTQQFSEWWKGL